MKYINNEKGFTLVEIIVSLFIISAVIIPVFQIFDGSQRNLDRAEEISRAMNLARQLMEESLEQNPPAINNNNEVWLTCPEDPRLDYQVAVELVNAELEVYQINVNVKYAAAGGTRMLTLSSYSYVK